MIRIMAMVVCSVIWQKKDPRFIDLGSLQIISKNLLAVDLHCRDAPISAELHLKQIVCSNFHLVTLH